MEKIGRRKQVRITSSSNYNRNSYALKILTIPNIRGKEMSDQIKVLIADDHGLFREILRKTLRREKDIKIVGEAANGPEAIDAIDNLKPDVVLLGNIIPKMSGIEIFTAIREKSRKTKVLMITAANDEALIFKTLKAGAKGERDPRYSHFRQNEQRNC